MQDGKNFQMVFEISCGVSTNEMRTIQLCTKNNSSQILDFFNRLCKTSLQ
jgi:hypothetical protein